MSNAYDVALRYVGQSVDIDNFPAWQPYQCVDIINAVADTMGMPRLAGNAIDLHNTQGLSNYADIIPYDPSQLQRGDIVLGSAGHAYGHVVFYGSGPSNNATVIDQNMNSEYFVNERTYNLDQVVQPTHIIRWKGQSYPSDSSSSSPSSPSTNSATNLAEAPNGFTYENQKRAVTYKLFEVVCDEPVGLSSSGEELDRFFKCNKVTGIIKGDSLEYHRNDNTVGYLPKDCVKELNKSESNTPRVYYDKPTVVDPYAKNREPVVAPYKELTLGDFIRAGSASYAGYKFTYMFTNNLPDEGRSIRDKSFNRNGFLMDKEGYLVLAMSRQYGDTVGNIYSTPFGIKGKVYYTINDRDGLILFIK